MFSSFFERLGIHKGGVTSSAAAFLQGIPVITKQKFSIITGMYRFFDKR